MKKAKKNGMPNEREVNNSNSEQSLFEGDNESWEEKSTCLLEVKVEEKKISKQISQRYGVAEKYGRYKQDRKWQQKRKKKSKRKKAE